MKVSHSIKVLIIAVLWSLLTIGGFGYVWLYEKDRGETLKQNIQILKDKESLERERIKLETLRKEYTESEAMLDHYVLKGDDGAVRFLAEIESLAQSVGVEVKTSRLEVDSDKGPFSTLSVSFNVSGQEERVTTFLELLELLPYRSEINRLRVTREVEPAELFNATVELSVSLIET